MHCTEAEGGGRRHDRSRRLPIPNGRFLQLGGRNPITTPNALRDGVLRFDASTGSFLCNHGITLASSTVEGRASSCHIVGRASDSILLRVLAPVSLATCPLLTGYLIEYALLMRFLAHPSLFSCPPERQSLRFREGVMYQFSWSTSLYCVNFKGFTRLIN